MAEQLKILVCGDVEGKFDKLYARVKNVMKKSGAFDYLFCVGNFFGSTLDEFLSYKSGTVKAPIPTYILGPNNSELLKFYPEINVNSYELAPNIIYLGKKGMFTTDNGLTVAYVSGMENSSLNKDCQITKDDVELVNVFCTKNQTVSYRGIDILLTSEWPAGVTKHDNNLINQPPKGSKLIAKLAYEVKPRYHFFGLAKKYYERSPYKNVGGSYGDHCTRAIGLANVGNDSKEKWLYAMNPVPLKYMRDIDLFQATTDTTECPYSYEETSRPQQFFFDMNYADEERSRKRKNRDEDFHQRTQKVMNVSQDDCWFCLASPKFEKHLVVSIGEEAYLTLAKGGLTSDHVMILPISHYRAFGDMPKSLQNEINKFKISLIRYYRSQGKVPVFFDRNFKTPHYQMHAIPISNKLIVRTKDLFMNMAEEKGLTLTEMPSNAKLEDVSTSNASYFYVEIGDFCLIHTIKKYFPLQFAREVLAHGSILNLPDRIEWRNCPTEKEEELKILEKFRKGYKPFDFTVV